MPESQLVVVSIVKDVHEIGVERVDVIQFGEPIDDASQLFVYGLLHEFDLAHVELSDTLDLEACRDLGRGLPLCLRQSDVDQVIRVWNFDDVFEVVGHGTLQFLLFTI